MIAPAFNSAMEKKIKNQNCKVMIGLTTLNGIVEHQILYTMMIVIAFNSTLVKKMKV